MMALPTLTDKPALPLDPDGALDDCGGSAHRSWHRRVNSRTRRLDADLFRYFR